jgi:COP9 signalosome complex subunit 2
VLASMLALSDINPFAAREAKVFADNKEISKCSFVDLTVQRITDFSIPLNAVAMSDLRSSLEANDLEKFEKTLTNKQNKIMDEPFLMTYIEPLRRRMKEQVLVNIVKPYKKLTLQFIAQQLSMTDADAEMLLVDMILDNRLCAYIDQVNGILTLESSSSKNTSSYGSKNTGANTASAASYEQEKYIAIKNWADELKKANGAIEGKLNM